MPEKETIMTKKVGAFFLLSLCLGALLLGCGKGSRDKELAKVNDVSITLEDFRQISERQSVEGKMRLLSEQARRDFLENYVITREVLYQEAKKKGYDQDKSLLAKVEDFKRAMVIDTLLEEALSQKHEVSDSEIEQYYKENIDRFTEPQEIKIRHIFVNSEPALREVMARLSQGESFEKLASIYNVDRSKDDGGNLGYLRRRQLSPLFAPFEEAAFSLRNKGDVSEVVKTPYGYHIIRLEDKRGAVRRPLAQVQEKIRVFLREKKKQDAYLAFVKESKGRAKITIDEKLWAEEEKKEIKPKDEKK